VVARYSLPPEAIPRLQVLVGLLSNDPLAPTAIRDPRRVVELHIADSLAALELEAVRRTRTALDLGSGAGLPGLALAIALPRTRFVLLDSSTRKAAFLERAVAACKLSNAEVVHARAESLAAHRGGFDLVTARAVAPLDVTAEYGAPLLRVGGSLVCWVGRRSPELDGALTSAADELGLGRIEIRRVEPFANAQHRHLYVMSKLRPTPDRFPRRPGAALKRPLGTTGGASAASDRGRR
jgi:16S rRNA (guanine527-N7)-methyltransferase